MGGAPWTAAAAAVRQDILDTQKVGTMVDGAEQARAFEERTGFGAFSATHVSHKRVEAYPIAAAEFEADGSGRVGVNVPARGYVIVPVPPGFLRRPGAVTEGDMLVRYEPTKEEPNGYLSHSPRAVFEAGYRRAAPVRLAGLTFGEALEALKAGARICRAGWNGKSMWLALSGSLNGREIPAESFWSLHNAEFARRNGGSATVLPCITMKTATGEILMGWLASQTDMLAEDWMLVEHGGASIAEEPRAPRFEGADAVQVIPPAA